MRVLDTLLDTLDPFPLYVIGQAGNPLPLGVFKPQNSTSIYVFFATKIIYTLVSLGDHVIR